jgi:hypothetical protein
MDKHSRNEQPIRPVANLSSYVSKIFASCRHSLSQIVLRSATCPQTGRIRTVHLLHKSSAGLNNPHPLTGVITTIYRFPILSYMMHFISLALLFAIVPTVLAIPVPSGKASYREDTM